MSNEVKPKLQDKSFHLRKLAKAGGTRYLSVGKILPPDWQAVMVYVDVLDSDHINLILIKLR